ncbi:glutaredoxin family protein [Fredinandcohnia sp. QZ13]|uniref:glutaredoxin family protein n=1 Tax=Fredinandcohnia sp. QZ13 TaxID=3073144 RepID=UPI002853661D|nr:glutaredoxin family protein [Fredinandcohnia sp. QZ13]MDR4889591.1 glutaredoxin family protein [Fredinandcohnia sp. QZ13]
MQVTMYSKENCSLCSKAKIVIEELSKDYPLDLQEIDIYKDDQLLEKYQIMIPVIEIDGNEVEYGIIHKETIQEYLDHLLKK